MKRISVLFIAAIVFSALNSFADDSVKNACPNGVNPKKSLIKTKILKHSKEKGPYGPEESIEYENSVVNERGQCYKVDSAKFVYLVDKNHAIYKVYFDSGPKIYIDPEYILFDYGTSSMKHRRVSGIIKATGLYATYKNREGFPRKMPQFLVVKESSH